MRIIGNDFGRLAKMTDYSKYNGFSLAEISVVLVILGIMGALVIPRASSFMAKSRRGEAEVNLEHIKSLQAVYRLEHGSDSSGWRVGYTGHGVDKCGENVSELFNKLGFRPNGCENLRYSYYVQGGDYFAWGPSDKEKKWIYPDCPGGGASKCDATAGDKLKASQNDPVTVCRDIIQYCPTDATGGNSVSSCSTSCPTGQRHDSPPTDCTCVCDDGSPPPCNYTCSASVCSSGNQLKTPLPSITLPPTDGLCCEAIPPPPPPPKCTDTAPVTCPSPRSSWTPDGSIEGSTTAECCVCSDGNPVPAEGCPVPPPPKCKDTATPPACPANSSWWTTDDSKVGSTTAACCFCDSNGSLVPTEGCPAPNSGEGNTEDPPPGDGDGGEGTPNTPDTPESSPTPTSPDGEGNTGGTPPDGESGDSTPECTPPKTGTPCKCPTNKPETYTCPDGGVWDKDTDNCCKKDTRTTYKCNSYVDKYNRDNSENIDDQEALCVAIYAENQRLGYKIKADSGGESVESDNDFKSTCCRVKTCEEYYNKNKGRRTKSAFCALKLPGSTYISGNDSKPLEFSPANETADNAFKDSCCHRNTGPNVPPIITPPPPNCPAEGACGSGRENKKRLEEGAWVRVATGNNNQCCCPQATPKWYNQGTTGGCRTTCEKYGEANCSVYGPSLGPNKPQYLGNRVKDTLILNTTQNFVDNCCGPPIHCNDSSGDQNIGYADCSNLGDIKDTLNIANKPDAVTNETYCCCPEFYNNWDTVANPDVCKTTCAVAGTVSPNGLGKSCSPKLPDPTKSNNPLTKNQADTSTSYKAGCCIDTCDLLKSTNSCNAANFMVHIDGMGATAATAANFGTTCCRPARCQEWIDQKVDESSTADDLCVAPRIYDANRAYENITNGFNLVCCKNPGAQPTCDTLKSTNTCDDFKVHIDAMYMTTTPADFETKCCVAATCKEWLDDPRSMDDGKKCLSGRVIDTDKDGTYITDANTYNTVCCKNQAMTPPNNCYWNAFADFYSSTMGSYAASAIQNCNQDGKNLVEEAWIECKEKNRNGICDSNLLNQIPNLTIHNHAGTLDEALGGNCGGLKPSGGDANCYGHNP